MNKEIILERIFLTDALTNSSQDGHSVRASKNPFVYINSLAIFISLVAMIFLVISPFATWHTHGLITDFVELKLRFASSSWSSNSLKLLFFAFLLCLVMSILLLLCSLGKITFRFPSKRLGLLGFIPSFAALIFTLLLVIYFIRHPYYHHLRLSVCFYSSLFSSILLMFLFILQLTKEPIFRSSAVQEEVDLTEKELIAKIEYLIRKENINVKVAEKKLIFADKISDEDTISAMELVEEFVSSKHEFNYGSYILLSESIDTLKVALEVATSRNVRDDLQKYISDSN